MKERTIQLQVEESMSQQLRLDVYLSTELKDFSRSRIQKLIDDEQVQVDGKNVKSKHLLKGGENIVISLPQERELELEPQDIPVSIIFEDDYLAVINKPVGLVVHPGAGQQEGTLVNALLHHMKGRLSGISGVLRPGIVHRLDKDTSGLLVVAKEDKTHRQLADQIKAKMAKRVYLALVEGKLPQDEGIIDKPIGRHPTKRKEMAIVKTGRQAISYYKIVKRWDAYTLVQVELKTGRTHQIRVHMADLGFPVVGDIIYNHKRTGSLEGRKKLGLLGHALHAFRLSFTHPITGKLLEFEAQLPQDFKNLIESL